MHQIVLSILKAKSAPKFGCWSCASIRSFQTGLSQSSGGLAQQDVLQNSFLWSIYVRTSSGKCWVPCSSQKPPVPPDMLSHTCQISQHHSSLCPHLLGLILSSHPQWPSQRRWWDTQGQVFWSQDHAESKLQEGFLTWLVTVFPSHSGKYWGKEREREEIFDPPSGSPLSNKLTPWAVVISQLQTQFLINSFLGRTVMFKQCPSSVLAVRTRDLTQHLKGCYCGCLQPLLR